VLGSLRSRRRHHPRPDDGADYVVVGAGSAGCVLAARLSEDPGTRVLLLEAGPPDRAKEIRIPAAFAKLFKSKFDWGYETAPQPGLAGRRIYFPRGRTLGGSSALNAQMWMPGHPADFEGWPKAWDWHAVRPYFERIESGPTSIGPPRDPNPMSRAFVECAAEFGVLPSRLSLAQLEGAGLVRVTQRRGLRCSAADAYLKPARRRDNLAVVTDAQALGLVLDHGRATGVRYRLGGEERTASARREVVLCAGAIGSPQLLMLSGVGPAESLRAHGIDMVHELPGVGQNLQDHCMALALFDASGADSLYAAEGPRQLLRLALRRRGLLTSNVGEAAAFVRTRPVLGGAPDLELIFAPVLYVEEGLVPPPSHGFSIASVGLRPRARGALTLRSAEPDDPPEIQPGYLTDPDDLRVLVEGVKLSRRIAQAGPLGRWLAGERAPGEDVQTDDAIETWVRATAQTLYHPVGTCRMGTDEQAVVDPQLRVRGLAGLRVVDASVMPRLNRGHTHAPTTMVAERAAEFIRRGPQG
jgi:choline dehydrogenase